MIRDFFTLQAKKDMENDVIGNKRIAKNTLFLYIRMFLVLVVSLYTSRVVLKTLGIEDYGIYNTVAGFVSMFVFLNSTLSSSVQRFYNFEGTKLGREGYEKVYTTGIAIHVILIIILLFVLESFGLWYVNYVMVIPPDRLFAANVVFQLSVISLMILILNIPYTGLILATERIDFYAMIGILGVVLRLLIVVILPYLNYDKLIVYGLLLLAVSSVDFLLSFFYVKNKFGFKFRWKLDKCYMNRLVSFSGWNLIGTFAFLLKGQGVNMLLNIFFGPLVNAARGIAYQVNGAITGFTSNIFLAYRPQIVNSYSADDCPRVKSLFVSESKICFGLISILIVPVIIDIDYILKLWLDVVPEHSSVFTKLVLIDSLICTLNTPCTQVVFATGNIRKYQIASSLVNMCLLPAAWGGLYIGYASSSVFMLTILFSVLNQSICIIQMNKVFPIGVMFYCKQILFPCVVFVVLHSLLVYLFSLFSLSAFYRLILICVVSVVSGGVLMYCLILGGKERKGVKKMLKKYL